MHRLFLHFCVFLLLAILGLGWSLEQLWRSEQQPLPQWLPAMQQAVASLAMAADTTTELSASAGLPVTSIPASTIAWPDTEAEQLAKGKAVALFAASGDLYLYLQQADQLWQIGPVYEAPDQRTYWYNLVFFMLLAFLTALWLWPLARDLKRLDRQLKYFNPATSEPLRLPRRSLIAKLADSFNQMQQHIKRLLQLQRELSQAVSHDLRTPLARMKFALGMDTNAPLKTDERAHLLRDIADMEQMVDSLLDYARLESQQDVLQREQVNLQELCYHLCEKLNASPGPSVKLSSTLPVTLVADGHYLERALMNLLTNARSHARTQVHIHLEPSANSIAIHVDDDGPGIPLAQRRQILKPFVRLDESRSRHSGGAGLGLAIVNRIADWHQGHLEVRTSPTGGARFTLWLPSHEQPADL